MTKVAIMQPTYLPWLGYFALMGRVDTFVFLDSVQFARRSWQQRNQILTKNGPKLLSVPVKKKGMRAQLIIDVDISNDENIIEKHISIITDAYKSCPFFGKYAKTLFQIMRLHNTRLVDLNVNLINYLMNVLDIDTPIVRSSKLNVNGKNAILLANICKELGANHYISPPGSRIYMAATDIFSKNKIVVSYHEYDHPIYNQLHDKFEPNMSIIDLLFNEGPNSKNILISGIK